MCVVRVLSVCGVEEMVLRIRRIKCPNTALLLGAIVAPRQVCMYASAYVWMVVYASNYGCVYACLQCTFGCMSDLILNFLLTYIRAYT